jgi:hypothetical protein
LIKKESYGTDRKEIMQDVLYGDSCRGEKMPLLSTFAKTIFYFINSSGRMGGSYDIFPWRSLALLYQQDVQ